MTERELIVAASREAANGTPDEASISLLLEDYRRRRDNLFADKDWLFLLQYYETSQLTKVTTDDRNILMPYKYRFPANASVQEVVSVNINLYTGIESLSVDDSYWTTATASISMSMSGSTRRLISTKVLAG